jgi:hypothetical protein
VVDQGKAPRCVVVVRDGRPRARPHRTGAAQGDDLLKAGSGKVADRPD